MESLRDASVWELQFEDQFEGTALDRSRWTTQWWWGRTKSADLAYYADEAVSVSGGALHLTAANIAQGGQPYTSGIATTQQSFAFTYGAVEVEATMHPCPGISGVAHLLAASTGFPPEVGLFKVDGSKTNAVDFWSLAPSDAAPSPAPFLSADGSDGTTTHLYRTEWSAGQVVWKVDGVEKFHTTEAVPQEPLYLTLSLEMGSGDPPSSPSTFPSSFDVQSIRIYTKR